MHTQPMADSEGEFSGWNISKAPHNKECDGRVRYRSWESSCGGYEDYQFVCEKCGKKWWVEGPDA